MKINSSYILLKEIRCYAYHGVAPEERKKFGYDVPNDADDADLEITRLKNEWLRDGQPVD